MLHQKGDWLKTIIKLNKQTSENDCLDFVYDGKLSQYFILEIIWTKMDEIFRVKWRRKLPKFMVPILK